MRVPQHQQINHSKPGKVHNRVNIPHQNGSDLHQCCGHLKMEKVPCVVIGAGAVGLSIAKSMSGAGISTLLLEKNAHFGEENSSRHSEVIHAGIYYPPNSLKSKFCIEGKSMMKDYIFSRGIAHNTCGKLIIACTDHERQALYKLHQNALASGVKDLRMLSKEDAAILEPHVTCVEAILSPSTTIFDSHALMLNYAADIENSATDSNILYNCEVIGVDRLGSVSSSGSAGRTSTSEFVVRTSQGSIACQYLINAGGLYSQHIASSMVDYPKQLIPTPYFAKGNYYKLQPSSSSGGNLENHSKPSDSTHSDTTITTNTSAPPQRTPARPFCRLVYPMPSSGGLGVHATLDLSGGVRFGPDVEWIRRKGSISSGSVTGEVSSVCFCT